MGGMRAVVLHGAGRVSEYLGLNVFSLPGRRSLKGCSWLHRRKEGACLCRNPSRFAICECIGELGRNFTIKRINTLVHNVVAAALCVSAFVGSVSGTETSNWEQKLEERRAWWSLQPLKPGIHEGIDAYIDHALSADGLRRSPRAERSQLIRRLCFVLTGLPPTPSELDRFAEVEVHVVVDELLGRRAFAERWARHWMDWWRYADSHGSEGDPPVPYAWQYRDYLVRALHNDVPYDQLLREHIAGDLLDTPRINGRLAINESAIGPAHFRMVFHGFSPTDALEEKVRVIDNQIDVITKAVMGLTVACARCHNHKFDAISQRDYFALYGIFANCRPAIRSVRVADEDSILFEMRKKKEEIKQGLVGAWLEDMDSFPGDSGPWSVALKNAKSDAMNPLHAWTRVDGLEVVDRQREEYRQWKQAFDGASKMQEWDAREAKLTDWPGRDALSSCYLDAGCVRIGHTGNRVITGVYPDGVYSGAGLCSDRVATVLNSPSFDIAHSIWVKVVGGGGAKMRYVIHGYPRDGAVYPVQNLNHSQFQWVKWDTSYWRGEQGYLEITTAADQPVLTDSEATNSWFGIQQLVVLSEQESAGHFTPKTLPGEYSLPLAREVGDLRARYQGALRQICKNWLDGSMSDEEANFLNYFVSEGLLPVTLDKLPALEPLVVSYRELEARLRSPVRVPGLLESRSVDAPVFKMGNHEQPGEPVPRGFLSALGGTRYTGEGSGRLALAEDLSAEENPLTARVAVNRLWHHVFGRGIVRTPDNLGRLGESPTHPELLDFLAHRFCVEGWSMKSAIRHMVLSETFLASSVGSEQANERDPENRLLSYYPVRRMDAESIRDAMLLASGQLDRTPFGPGDEMDSRRRSIYLSVVRNKLDPLLRVFDFPEPMTTRGCRDQTNVPAQSLALMHDPRIHVWAEDWGTTLARSSLSDERKVDVMFSRALGRSPSEIEHSLALQLVTDGGTWKDLAHALFNLKEFIYVR